MRALLLPCAGAAVLLGCPLYPDGCDSRNDCASGFYCDRFNGRCERVRSELGCLRPSDCAAGETCTPDFVCRSGSCDFHGCVRGYRCGVLESAHACVGDVDHGDASMPPPADAGEPVDAGSTAADSGSSPDAAADASL